MSEDKALDRLLSKRSRPKVPARPDNIIESSSQDVKTKVSQDTKSTRQLTGMKTTRSTIRLEENLDKELRLLCTQEEITKETWIESAFLHLNENPDTLGLVIQQARHRLQKRKEIADFRRATTMKKRIEEME